MVSKSLSLLYPPRMAGKAAAPSVGTVALRRRCTVQARAQLFSFPVRASQSPEDRNDRVYKQLGLFSLKKKIEDAVSRAEIVTPTALELEESRRIEQEEMLRGYNLWDDLARSNESLTALADSIKVVDDLKDIQYKVEEAKLIAELAEMDIISHRLFKQAYKASRDVSKFLDCYEMSKLLKGPYDREGVCMIIRAGSEGFTSEVWAEKLLNMYISWARKNGYKSRVTEKKLSMAGGIREATLELESEYVYGYLAGEKGTHRMIHSSLDGSVTHETCSAGIDVIPLFIERAINLQIDDNDLEITSVSCDTEDQYGCRTEPAVRIHHIPSSTTVECSGERSHFANKIKALNRLKAKLLVVAHEQRGVEVEAENRDATPDYWKYETRRYVFRPHKMVHDMKTGIQLPELNSVLEGNLEVLIGAHINLRYGRDK